MRKTILLSLSLLCACALSAATKSYTADDNTDFVNPERGFYHYSDVHLKGNGSGGLSTGSDEIQACQSDKISLLFRYFYLDKNGYNSGTAITQQDLNMIASDFAVARQKGIKIIVRFSYGEDGYHSDDNWSFTEPTKSGMQAHMAQLKPVLAANADVIACVQAGFVGIWGEWYFSSTFGKDWSKPNAVSDRNDLINSLLDMTPADRCLQLRTIHYITEYIGNGNRNYTTKLNDQTAFSGSNQSRIGHHNDAFCANKENDGTYYYYNDERTYLANLSQYVPVGGENNGYSSNYTTGAKAMADMEQMHYDYMNTEYDSNTINQWKSQKKDGVSYYDIMKRRLGYRLQLQSFTYDDQVAKNAKLNVTLKIKNAGFSNLYNKRIAYLVLKNNSKTYQIALASDPRLWKAGQVTTITEKLTLPSDIVTGTYNVYLYLPDNYASIASNAAYAVRLANQNMGWSNGMNDLGASITVTAAQEGGQDQEEEEEEQGQGQGQETPSSTTNVTYTADNTTDFPNPERGFYDHTEWTVTNKSSNLDASYLTEALSENRTLLLRLYYLNNYRSADLPTNFLTQFTNDMAKFRQNGCKAIVRFAYDNDTGDGYQDGSLTYWKRHLDQLKQVLNDNADVIYVVQAGFLGVWGEWYYSSAGTGSQIPANTKTQLIDKLLECVPTSRFVQLRTPKFKRDYTGYTAAMSANDAYQNTPRARLGHHNDAFLNGESNSGTYENRTTDMNYLATECLYVPNGGENNIMNEESYNTWGTGAIAKAEMAQLHYSYMNSGYSEVATNRWKNDGSFAEMSRNLGYRYQLTSAVLPAKGTIGKTVNIQLNIKNVGYAPLYNERHAYIVLKNGSKTYTVQLASDPRTWLPNGVTTAINENITLPSNMTEGTYTMYLWLPDAYASIASNPKYAVRFANSNVWESSTGYNKLNASIVVSATGGDEPGPTPTPSVDPISNLSASAVDASSIALTWTNPTGSSSPSTEALTLASAQAYAASGTATPSVNGANLVVNYSNVVAWDVAGVQFALASRSDIASISYTLTGDGQDVDFIVYVADAGGAQWYEDVKKLSSTTAATYTMTPANQLWTDKSHTVGSQPYTALYLVANPELGGSGSFTLSNITLNLVGGGTVPAQFTQVKLVRKVGAAPTSVSDGTVVYTGNAQAYTDTELSASTHYYYAAYSYNNSAVSATVLTADATTKAASPDPGPTPISECEVAIDLTTGVQMSDAEGGTASCSVSGDVLTVNYQTDGEWKYTGVEFPIGSRSDIESVTFSFKGASSSSAWTALHIYLSDGTTRYVDSNADYSIHTDADWQTVTIAPNSVLWGSAASIEGIAMTKIGFMANPDIALSSSFQVKDIYFKIKDCPHTPTATPAAREEESSTTDKFLHRGKLYIRHHGAIYGILGQPIRNIR